MTQWESWILPGENMLTSIILKMHQFRQKNPRKFELHNYVEKMAAWETPF